MSELSVFNFDSQAVRTLTRDGEPWFVAADVCDALGLGDTSKACSRLDDDDEKLIRTMFVSGQNREVLTINESGLYSLILTSRKPEAKRFKKWVTSEVLPSIRKTGQYIAPLTHSAGGVLRDELEAVDVLARILNVANSGKLGMVRASLAHHGAAHLLPTLPVYAIDAPTTATSAPASSMPTASLTVLLNEHDIGVSAVTANKMLARSGMLEEMTRPSSKGAIKRFWSVTEAGQKYGKNVTSPSNPKETLPHWYRDTFKELVRLHLVA